MPGGIGPPGLTKGSKAMATLTMAKLLEFPEVGTRMHNGATLLHAVITHSETGEDGRYHYGFVLALWGSEFVVWRLGVRPDLSMDTRSGRYFGNIIEAVAYYEEKVAYEEEVGKA